MTRRPLSGPDDPRHGRHSGYMAGCKEECCRAASRASKARWRAQIRAIPLSPDDHRHGKPDTYRDYACRCDRCTAAATAANGVPRRPRLATSG